MTSLVVLLVSTLGVYPNTYLVHAYVTSRLDYCNSILYGSPKYQLSKLQCIQNMAARLITDTLKFDHINPVLYNLPVNYRIQFKILMITSKAIHDTAPSYLSDLIGIRSLSRYSLHNNDTIFLEPPKGVMRTALGARSFHASTPALWNSLPAYIWLLKILTGVLLHESQPKCF